MSSPTPEQSPTVAALMRDVRRIAEDRDRTAEERDSIADAMDRQRRRWTNALDVVLEELRRRPEREAA